MPTTGNSALDVYVVLTALTVFVLVLYFVWETCTNARED